MKKWKYLAIAIILTISQVASANRVGDAWSASNSRIHGRFARNRGRGSAAGLFLLSSTTITSLSSTALTTGGDLLKKVSYREAFVDENLYAIKLDSAKGQGEYLQTLAELSGCSGAAAQSQFGAKIRSNFKNVYDGTSNQDPAEITQQIDQLIQADPQMQKSCHVRAATAS